MVKGDFEHKLLAATLKHLRERAGLSQLELALLMGWQGNSPVNDLEHCKRHPKPATLERWIDCTNGTYPELYYCLGLAKVVPSTRFPTLNQINDTLEVISERLRNYPYSAYVIDYRTTFWIFNSPTIPFSPKLSLPELLKKQANILDIIFNGELGIRGQFEDIETIDYQQVARFKALNLYRQHEMFFRSYPHCMEGRVNMPADDYKHFCDVWNNTQAESMRLSMNSGFDWWHRSIDNQVFHLRTTLEPIFSLGNLFHIVLHHPYTENDFPGNQQRLDTYLAPYQQTGCYKLWDNSDAQELLNSYKKQ